MMNSSVMAKSDNPGWLRLSDPLLLKDRCLIGGRWTGTPTDGVMNPATGETLADVPRLGAQDAEDAIEAAGEAFSQWSALTAKNRSVLLKRWFDLIIDHRDDLARILTAEQGKPLAEARGEIDYAASFIEFYAEEAKRTYGDIIPSHRQDARILVLRQPIGVIAAITPWNFPAAMVTRKLAPALAAGCTAVLKPAPETPLTALALAGLAQRAEIPAGVLNVITGDAPTIGAVLSSHPSVRLISFTGSTEVGKLLMRQAAGTVKKVDLELGGNAPFIVFDDADLGKAVEGAMQSKFRNMGQTCVCANRLYVQDGIHDRFVERLTERVAALQVGNGLSPDVEQGPLINLKAVEKVERHVADALAKGARLETGGNRHALGGTYYEPTVLTSIDRRMIITDEETFGPVAPVYHFTDEDDMIRQVNESPFGLAAYFFTRDLSRAFRTAERLEYGMIGINAGLLATELAPFGGIKQSGLGREGSRHGIEEYLELKYVLAAI